MRPFLIAFAIGFAIAGLILWLPVHVSWGATNTDPAESLPLSRSERLPGPVGLALSWSATRRGQTSPYWVAERKLVAARKQAGRLGAEVRQLRRELHAHQARLRTLQHTGSLPDTFRSLAASFGCIHDHEGSWGDTGAPYWGGVQADEDFMRTWAPELLRRHGTADHWTPLQQVAMAILAWTERGYQPWPNTSRECGLS